MKHQVEVLEAVTPKALYADCMSEEERLKKLNHGERILQILREYLFEHHPLFLPASFEPLMGYVVEKRYPFDFSIIQPKDTQVSEHEWRYKQILEHLKKLESIELRLLFIGRWLKQERVCEPEQIIPRDSLRRALVSFMRERRISKKDAYYWNLVEIWRPYFDRLLKDLRGVPKANRGRIEELMKQGYEAPAIEAAHGKRSSIPAIISWLETRISLNARSLENAHSRVEAKKQKMSSARRERHNNHALKSVQ